ncbi:MAG: RNA polymerase sigma factor RpoD [Candidatus Omnitrophica bacterium CG11_big_fil_rev_8_21_14_0_20_63_9]|nr:MAG: RNA polymerase sigma factor RpoD [Candidatus Omnitrophica bacterium CG11_big_fil_rev_8_21_14_0_20_63_9]
MDPIRSYLKDIKSIPLLTAKEEIDLATRIKKGDLKAKRQMTLSNLRLVINIAKRYSHLGVPLLDLVEEGNLGLMKAVVKYNPKKGFRFSTYGAWWIRQYITRAIANQGKTVRIPVYMTELISKFKRITEELAQKLGRKPTAMEIARRMRLPVERIERLQELVTAAQATSLETPVGEEGETEMIDLLEDENAKSPQEDISRFLQHERIEALLQKMSERERRVLVLRYGLDDGVSRTLGETAKHFGITRERVRQIEVVAIRKLRVLIAAEEAQQAAMGNLPTPISPPKPKTEAPAQKKPSKLNGKPRK